MVNFEMIRYISTIKSIKLFQVAQRSSPFEAPSGGVVVTGEAPESDTDDQDMFALPREIPSLQNQHLLGDVTMKVEDETSVGREGVVWKKFQS